jgi:iron complex transport system permease protein
MHTTVRPYLINALLLIVAFVLSVAIGAVFIPPATVVRILVAQVPGFRVAATWPETFSTILFSIRLPHAVLIMLTGAALASSGATYQGLFRNPLADPYLIGVASGAGLGAVLAMSIHWPMTMLGLYLVPFSAFLGASLTVALVYFLARSGRTVPITMLILAGVAISSFATSLTSFLMLQSNEELRRALSWLLGGSLVSGWDPIIAVFPYILVGMLVLSISGHTLNVMQFGDEQAQQLGIPVERRKLILIIAASLTTAAAVAFSGVIGFIGLIVPHLMRMVWGPDYRRLVSLSILGGGTALLVADLLARTLIAPQVLPVGIVTALAGAPFFLWVLRRTKNQGNW